MRGVFLPMEMLWLFSNQLSCLYFQSMGTDQYICGTMSLRLSNLQIKTYDIQVSLISDDIELYTSQDFPFQKSAASPCEIGCPRARCTTASAETACRQSIILQSYASSLLGGSCGAYLEASGMCFDQPHISCKKIASRHPS